MKDKQETKSDMRQWLDEMNAKQAANKKREEEEAYWNAPLDIKDRD